LVVKK